MNKSGLWKFLQSRCDYLTAALIFILTFFIFLFSPLSQIADSKYSMLLSESLIKNRSFTLDNYAIPRLTPIFHDNNYKNGNIYQIELVGDHLYYYFPPGTSVLSAPYVGLMNLLGISAANADGTYSQRGEEKIEVSLAALLMATLASIFFFTARLVLPWRWSLLIALGGALGTQIWSTASRGMWTHTWGALLLGLALWMLLAQETGKRDLKPVLFASLLSWMYFVRPTSSIFIVALSLYIFLYHRRFFLRYAITGAVWFAGFAAYSLYHYGQLMPNYYQATRLNYRQGWTALAGNLISPGRGLLIYVPILLFVAYLLARYRKQLIFPRMVWLTLVVSAAHLLVTSGFTPWQGGHCYGPRYSTDLVPWFVLLSVLGVKAMLDWREKHATKINVLNWYAPMALGGVLLLLSVFINGRGAISIETAKWNAQPINIDKLPSRIWDWTYPQFLAGILHPPLPPVIPPIEGRIEFSRRSAEANLWYGWSGNEEMFRWTDAGEATVVFALDEITDANLRMKFAPFLVSGKLDEQRVNIEINGKRIETLTVRDTAPQEYSLSLPKELLRQSNVLTFGLPDATSPRSLLLSEDPRRLGIAMFWLELQTPNSGQMKANQPGRATVASMPLPDNGYSAEVSALDAPDTLSPGQQATVHVKVKNLGGTVWQALGQSDSRFQVQLGNHWLDANGKTVIGDDARAPLPYDLRPEAEVELPLTVKAPPTPGEYILEIDMLQEHMVWFADEGSKTARVKITVK
jgi:hypothetical protein